jgi:glycerol-3-phosphate acyltransferase PlsY
MQAKKGSLMVNVAQLWQITSTGQALELVFVAIVAYLYGSIPFAYLVTYLTRRRILTEEGTGNVGVVNAYRAGGVLAVVITVLGDLSKVFVSIGLAELLFPGQDYVKLLTIFTAFVGTNFSVFLRGRGGRGSTMLMWSLAVVSLWSCLIICAIMALCFLLARVDIRLKSMWIWFFPVVLLLVERDWAFLIFGVLVVIVILAKGRRSLDDLVFFGYVPRKKRSAEHRREESSGDDFSRGSAR